ncbi:MAG: hypothetical protein ACLTRS_18080 [Lachnospiraceae bacterium]
MSKAAYKTAKTNKIKRSRADLIFDIILYTIGTILIHDYNSIRCTLS